jgi:hypothetical protein
MTTQEVMVTQIKTDGGDGKAGKDTMQANIEAPKGVGESKT